jgi:hypothetical protein
MKSQTIFLVSFVFLLVGFSLGRVIPLATTSTPKNSTMHDHKDHGSVEIGNMKDISTISITTMQRKDNSIDLYISTSNFVFTPEKIGSTHVYGTGHGHLYINDQKITRFYSNWIQLDKEKLSLGANTVCASLNTNTHAHYTVNGEIIESCVIIVN